MKSTNRIHNPEFQKSRFADMRSLASSQTDEFDLSFLDPPHAPSEIGWFEHYRLLRLLGVGGMGAVFLAEDSHLLRLVALKIVQPSIASDMVARQRFLREARAMASIQHDHVIGVYHVGMATIGPRALELPYLAMQYTPGETLLDYLIREDRPPFSEVARIGREIAEGLEAAHAQGVIHRDIKPSNIWLTATRRRVKIIDFGLARPQQTNTALSTARQIIGTPYFMSPEQALGEQIDPRADFFSLGCVLYAALCGELPFDGETPIAVLTKLALHEPKPLLELRPDVPLRFAQFVHRLLAKLPDKRIASASEAVEALEEIETICRAAGSSTVAPARR